MERRGGGGEESLPEGEGDGKRAGPYCADQVGRGWVEPLPQRTIWSLGGSGRSHAGYTRGMKVAISLPDALHRKADALARRTGRSRSRLYADALADYLARQAPDSITDRLNDVCDSIPLPDPFASAAAKRVLRESSW